LQNLRVSCKTFIEQEEDMKTTIGGILLGVGIAWIILSVGSGVFGKGNLENVCAVSLATVFLVAAFDNFGARAHKTHNGAILDVQANPERTSCYITLIVCMTLAFTIFAAP
jgi:hypothetical protein